MIGRFDSGCGLVDDNTPWTQSQPANTLHPVSEWNIVADAADQLERITVAGQPEAGRMFRYDPAGNRVVARQGDGVTTGTFNALNQLIAVSAGGNIPVRGTTDEPATVVVQGRPAWMTGGTNFVATATAAAGTNTIPIVATDGSGNARTNTYRIVVPDIAPRNFLWDENGNLLSDGVRSYAWDAENRPIRITQGTDVFEYNYNALSQRQTRGQGAYSFTFSLSPGICGIETEYGAECADRVCGGVLPCDGAGESAKGDLPGRR
jgi:YD repeat-containing protein